MHPHCLVVIISLSFKYTISPMLLNQQEMMKMHNQSWHWHQRQPKWEKKLTSKLVIWSLKQGLNSILIPVHLKTTDTLEEVGIDALVNCGATGDFIDEGFVEQTKIPTQNLSQPIPVYNVDGSLNEAGSITKVADMVMTYKGHSE